MQKSNPPQLSNKSAGYYMALNSHTKEKKSSMSDMLEEYIKKLSKLPFRSRLIKFENVRLKLRIILWEGYRDTADKDESTIMIKISEKFVKYFGESMIQISLDNFHEYNDFLIVIRNFIIETRKLEMEPIKMSLLQRIISYFRGSAPQRRKIKIEDDNDRMEGALGFNYCGLSNCIKWGNIIFIYLNFLKLKKNVKSILCCYSGTK